MMQNAFEFAEELKDSLPPEAQRALAAVEADRAAGNDAFSVQNEKTFSLMDDDDRSHPSSRRSTITENPTTMPFMSLATFRMVVLADELLESFFSEDLQSSWHLEPLTEDVPPPKATGATGRFANFVGSFMTDENKEFLGKLADDIGKRLDIQQVEQKPSLGRLSGAAAMQEPQERATLLSTSKTKSPRLPVSPIPSVHDALASEGPSRSGQDHHFGADTGLSPAPINAVLSPSSITAAAEDAIIEKVLPNAPKESVLGLGIMDERPRFAIDDAGDDQDLEDDDDLLTNDEDDKALLNGASLFIQNVAGVG